jgi:acetate kinase
MILVLNCGSSSIKFAVINGTSESHHQEQLLHGLIERVGTDSTSVSWTFDESKKTRELGAADYESAMRTLMEILSESGGMDKRLTAVGHRVVHGGEYFTESVVIDDRVLECLKACIPLAPLHNPANILGIEVAKKSFATLPQVAVFDTAFHQTMPEHAYIYPLPYSLYQDHKIRRYGFHGISHRYVTERAAEILNKPYHESAFISAHLGNGCSLTAVLNGKSIDTSMGLTPLEGLVMGTRCGDIDPSIPEFIAKTLGYDAEAVTTLLNKKSGLLGISDVSMDMRALNQAAASGNQQAALAIDIFCYRLAKYIAAFMVPLERLDALIFTGGIGENDKAARIKVLQWLQVLNFQCDENRNQQHGQESDAVITKENSRVALVIPTNEEGMIARDTINLVSRG